MGHEFVWEDPEGTPVREDPPAPTGRPVPGAKEPDPMGFPFDFGEWWQVAKWGYVGAGVVATAMGVLGTVKGWVPTAYWGFVLQIVGISVGVYLDDAASSGSSDRRSRRKPGGWPRPPGLEHPDLAPETPLGACLDRSLDLARNAEQFRFAVDSYALCILACDAAGALTARELAETSLARFKASALEAAVTFEHALRHMPPALARVEISRQQVVNVVNDILRSGQLPAPERELLRAWPVMDEKHVVAELRATWREQSIPPTLSGGTFLVLTSGALRHLARNAGAFLPNGM